MHVAILHYHLNRGGVTQVIINQLRALATAIRAEPAWQIAIVSGGRRADWPQEVPEQVTPIRLTLIDIPAMDYEGERAASPQELARQIRAGLQECGFAPEDTVLHVHNHSLGKNLSLPGALRLLAQDGFRLLLQIHDFAEDYRPANYARMAEGLPLMAPDGADDLGTVLYPQATHIHYATLNRRDWSVLQGAGVPTSRLHVLPNPVPDASQPASGAAARLRLAEACGVPVDGLFVLYPVRGIRRKNLGEMLLWSAVAKPNSHFGCTLPPLNPVEQPSYLRWKQLATDLRLPCHFELGTLPGMRLSELLAAADRILTTSVTEGFGMVFLESWLAGRALVGRDLPEISADFVAAGLRFAGLHPELRVPLEWIGRGELQALLEGLYAGCLRSFGRSVPAPATLTTQVEELLAGDTVDFARLDSGRQVRVIGRVHDAPSDRRRLLELNPWFERALSPLDDATAEAIRQNAAAVRRGYSLDACGPRLLDLYRTVGATPRSAALEAPRNAGHILDTFLDLSRFRPIWVSA